MSRGSLFPACMFIGLGLGLTFRRPDVGVLVGMGAGFLAMSLISLRSEPVTVRLPSSIHGYFLVVLGLALLIAGPALIYRPEILYPYLVAALLTLLGIGIAVLGFRNLSRE